MNLLSYGEGFNQGRIPHHPLKGRPRKAKGGLRVELVSGFSSVQGGETEFARMRIASKTYSTDPEHCKGSAPCFINS